MYNNSTMPVAQTLTELSSVVENLLLLLSEKEKTVIKKRFNLDKVGKHTLEEIGDEFSVTRERIRQIEKNALAKMKRNVFNTALRNLHDFVTNVVRSHGSLVKKDSLINELAAIVADKNKVDFSCLDLSLALHEDLDCIGNTINFYPYVKERTLPDYFIKHASDHVVNQLNKHGDKKNLSKIHEDLKPALKDMDFDVVKVKSLINIDKRLVILDGDLVALLEWRHINPRTLRDKILYVLRNETKPLHFTNISEKISSKNFDNKVVNLQAVHNELIRHDSFVLIGRGIYALKEWGYENGTVAEVIKAILKDKKELSQEEIIDLVLQKRQVKKITIILALKNNKKFTRVGRKQYRLAK